MNYWYFIIPAIIFVSIFIFILLLHFRKKRVIKKVNSLNTGEKKQIINDLIEPLGYIYDIYQDVFATRLDAFQKQFGYTTFYDLSAAYFNMVFDYETIYFDYNGRTWLIEMWKGQYGINAGCEIGIYYADSIVPKEKLDTTLFHAVDTNDMLDISLRLNKHENRKLHQYTKLGQFHYRHWWLTLFKMGVFAKPKDLFINASIRFKDYAMLRHFLDSFIKTLPDTLYKVNGLTVYFTFYHSRHKYSLWKKMVRHIALAFCHLYCKWFNFVTRPFSNSGDKLLYIYYYLPFTVRFILRGKPGK